MEKGSATIILLLLILFLILFGGVYYFNRLQASRDLITPIVNNGNDKNSYSNQSLGFEFQYTKDLTVKQDSEEEFDKRENGTFRKNFTGYVGHEPGKFLGAVVILNKNNSFDMNPFTVWVFNNDSNLTIDKWHHNFWYYPFVWGDFTYAGKFILAPQDMATVSGQIGKSGTIDYREGKPKFIYISKDQKMYLFRIIGQSGEEILTSFKFLQ